MLAAAVATLGAERSHERRLLPARGRRDEVERVNDMRFLAGSGEARASQALAKALLETCADSTDPDDRPAAVAEAFEAGYAYGYELRPE
jgi:hypothetical protein